jgi:hypothetical protein
MTNQDGRTYGTLLRWAQGLLGALALALFACIIPAVKLAKGFFKSYGYFGFNPLYALARLPSINLFVAVALFVLLGAVIILGVMTFNRPSKLPSYARALLVIACFLCTCAWLGCLHAITYYIRPRAYQIDSSILALQSQRNDQLLKGAESRVREKLVFCRKLIGNLSSEPAANFSTELFRGPAIGTRSVFTDNFLYGHRFYINSENTTVQAKIYADGCVVEAERAGLSLWALDVLPSDEQNRGAVAKFCGDLLGVPVTVSSRMLVPVFEDAEKSLQATMAGLRENKQPINLQILTWDLLVYDTLLSSMTLGQGYFKPVNLFSRSLSFVHALVLLLFFILVAPKLSDLIKRHQAVEEERPTPRSTGRKPRKRGSSG